MQHPTVGVACIECGQVTRLPSTSPRGTCSCGAGLLAGTEWLGEGLILSADVEVAKPFEERRPAPPDGGMIRVRGRMVFVRRCARPPAPRVAPPPGPAPELLASLVSGAVRQALVERESATSEAIAAVLAPELAARIAKATSAEEGGFYTSDALPPDAPSRRAFHDFVKAHPELGARKRGRVWIVAREAWHHARERTPLAPLAKVRASDAATAALAAYRGRG